MNKYGVLLILLALAGCNNGVPTKVPADSLAGVRVAIANPASDQAFLAAAVQEELLAAGCVPSDPDKADLLVQQYVFLDRYPAYRITKRNGSVIDDRHFSVIDCTPAARDNAREFILLIEPRYKENKQLFR